MTEAERQRQMGKLRLISTDTPDCPRCGQGYLVPIEAADWNHRAGGDSNTACPVDHPPHYNAGGIECIDALAAALGPAGFEGFCAGNAIKYLWRWKLKAGTTDLEKARWYVDRLIATKASPSGLKGDE